MGLLSWLTGRKAPPAPARTEAKNGGEGRLPEEAAGGVAGMNGAEEVRRPTDVTVFEFGSAAATGDRLTMAGYCPVSEELEPCRWEILPANGPDAPQFRIVF